MSKRSRETQTMIEQNNVLREKLNDTNKTYYEQLLLYIRTTGLFYDDYEVETLLLQILQDILSAQEDGQSAADFFGNNPQDAANELIEQLGKASGKEMFKMIGLIFGISSFFSVISALSTPKAGINGLVLLLNAVLSVLIIEAAFFLIHKSAYKKIVKGKLSSFLLLWLGAVLIIGLFIVILIFTPAWSTIYLPNSVALLLLALLLIGTTIYIFNCDRENRKLWLSFIPFIYILCLIGILFRLPMTEHWMSSPRGKMITVFLVLAGLLMNWLFNWFILREKRC